MIRIGKKNHPRDEPRIELTPLVDVVFLLLIFFLLTATSVQHTFDITLPDAKSSLPHSTELTVEIAITEQGDILLQGKASTLEIIEALPQSSEVVIFGDEGAPYGIFVKVIDALRINGIERITIATGIPR